MKFPVKTSFILFSLLLSACARESAPLVDVFGASNMSGGAVRTNMYSGVESQPITTLISKQFSELTGAMISAPLLYTSDSLLLLSTGGTVSLARYDSIYWSLPLGPVVPGLAADSSGQIYAVLAEGEVVAIRNGATTWRQLPASLVSDTSSSGFLAMSIPLAMETGVVVASSTGTIDRLRGDGSSAWSVRRGASVMRMLAAAPGAGVVAAVTHNSYDMPDTLVALDPATGAERWTAVVAGARILEGPAIIGNLIVIGAASRQDDGTRMPYAIAFGFNGKERWRTPLVVTPRGIAGDNAGNIYVSGAGVRRDFAGGIVVSLDSAGKERWQVILESAVPAAPALSDNLLYFVSRQDGRTGLFSYSHDGTFRSFVPINLVPDVLPQPVITHVGQVVLAGLDQPVLVEGSD